MSYALNLVETEDGYGDRATLECPGAIKLNLTVANNGVFYRYAPPSREHPRGGVFNPEVYLPPFTYLLARNAAIVQFRSAVAGKPAIVTLEALTADD